jgi:hypothetical protein
MSAPSSRAEGSLGGLGYTEGAGTGAVGGASARDADVERERPPADEGRSRAAAANAVALAAAPEPAPAPAAPAPREAPARGMSAPRKAEAQAVLSSAGTKDAVGDAEGDDLAEAATEERRSADKKSANLEARAAAVPRDYDPGWHAAVDPRIGEIYATAEGAGLDDAVALYAMLAGNADPRVAQDAAWRAAVRLSGAGRHAQALTTIAAALRRSSGNTPFRANLLLAQGDAMAALGDLEAASSAWRQAARLNAAR